MEGGVDLRAIAASCNGYVGADLGALCREAALAAWRRSPEASEGIDSHMIQIEDWEHARKEVKPSITRGIAKETSKVSWEDIGGLQDLKVSKGRRRLIKVQGLPVERHIMVLLAEKAQTNRGVAH